MLTFKLMMLVAFYPLVAILFFHWGKMRADELRRRWLESADKLYVGKHLSGEYNYEVVDCDSDQLVVKARIYPYREYALNWVAAANECKGCLSVFNKYLMEHNRILVLYQNPKGSGRKVALICVGCAGIVFNYDNRSALRFDSWEQLKKDVCIIPSPELDMFWERSRAQVELNMELMSGASNSSKSPHPPLATATEETKTVQATNIP